MKRVFLAGKFETRETLRRVRAQLLLMGYTVVSRWLDEPSDGYPGDSFWWERSEIDVTDVARADIFVLDTLAESATGGREVELGLALARPEVEVFLVGPRRNIHHFRVKTVFESWEEALDYFAGRRERRCLCL